MRFADCHPDRKHQAKGMCKSCYDKHLKQINPDYKDRQLKNTADWIRENKPKYRRDPEKIFNRALKRNYGLSREDYDQMLIDQKHVCAICEKAPSAGKKLHVDHNHNTGKVRGLLCFSCNWFVSVLDKDPTAYNRIKEFLE